MSEDKTKDLALYDMEKIHLVPRPNFLALRNLKEENKKLNDDLQARHKEYMEMSNRLDKNRVRYLEKFRAVFCYHCIVLNRELDLIACRNTIAEGRCRMHETCVPRNDLLDKLHLANGELGGDRNPSPFSPPLY